MDYRQVETSEGNGAPMRFRPVSYHPRNVEWDPWRFGMTSLVRLLASPSEFGELPAPPKLHGDEENLSPQQAISYWSAAYYLLKYSLGWREPALGFERCGENEAPISVADDVRIALIRSYWRADPYADAFTARLWDESTSGAEHRPPELWFHRLQNLYEEAPAPLPYGGGSDPLHLQNVNVVVVHRNPSQKANLFRSADDRRACLLLDRFDGWYYSLRESGDSLPGIDNQSWYVDVVVKEVGWLGTYRKSRVTGLWFAGKHRYHMLGNGHRRYE